MAQFLIQLKAENNTITATMKPLQYFILIKNTDLFLKVAAE